MSKYRIGVIGTGARGETFARSLYAGTARAELFGLCDLDADRLQKFCDYCQLPNARRWTDPAAFLREPGLDAVIITVPEFAHADVAVAAMKNGKHVYIEKPLAHTIADAQRIVAAQRETGRVAYVGFNLRASLVSQKLHEIVASGVLGKIVHLSGLEQLHRAHGAAFMRRFHRFRRQSGGLLNHKCCHDLDIMLWVLGHQHRVTRVASFGGCNVFTPDRQPAKHCHECPQAARCPYRAVPGFVFPVGGPEPIYHQDETTYGGDLCVFDGEKELVDNQTVIWEFANGVRADFRLEMFQYQGRRRLVIWGEQGMAEMDGAWLPGVKVTTADGDETVYSFAKRTGGHGGTDPAMIGLFIDAIESGGKTESGLAAGLAATILAVSAEEARLAGKVVEIPSALYEA